MINADDSVMSIPRGGSPDKLNQSISTKLGELHLMDAILTPNLAYYWKLMSFLSAGEFNVSDRMLNLIQFAPVT